MSVNSIRRAAFGLAAIICMTGQSATAAHPFHTSHAEMEFNPKTKKLEVALRMYPGDLERAVARMQKSPVRLEKTQNINDLILRYVNSTFLTRSKDSKKWQSAKWVGKELNVKTIWVYVEIPCKDGLDGLVVRNRIFHELQANQINTVDFRERDRRLTLSFRKNKSDRTLKLADFKVSKRTQSKVSQAK